MRSISPTHKRTTIGIPTMPLATKAHKTSLCPARPTTVLQRLALSLLPQVLLPPLPTSSREPLLSAPFERTRHAVDVSTGKRRQRQTHAPIPLPANSKELRLFDRIGWQRQFHSLGCCGRCLLSRRSGLLSLRRVLAGSLAGILVSVESYRLQAWR